MRSQKQVLLTQILTITYSKNDYKEPPHHASPVLRDKDHIGGLLWRKAGMGGYKQLFRQWLLD